MFEFIKKLFSTELPKENIHLSEIPSWIESKIKPWKEDLNNMINDKNNELKEIKAKAETLTKDLIEAVPQDEDKIMPKVRNVVEGHRQNYVKRVSRLMEELQEINPEKVKEFCEDTENKLNEFGNTTAKSFYATQHLFHKPVEGLSNEIKKISGIVKDIKKSIEDSNIDKSYQIRKKAEKILEEIGILEESRAKLKEIDNKKQELIKQGEDIDKSTIELKKSEDYKTYEKSIERLMDLNDALKEINTIIYENIVPLETALKKYERMAMDNTQIIKDYIKGPVEALAKDEGLKIIEVLKALYKAVIEDTVELKDKKKSKTLQTIHSLTRSKLEDYREKYIGLQSKIAMVKKDIHHNEVKSKENDLIKDKEKVESDIKRSIMEFENINKIISKINIEKEKEALKENIKETFSVEVSL